MISSSTKQSIRDLLTATRLLPERIGPWLAAKVEGRRRYRALNAGALLDTRRSDTVFVFGSGASLNELSAEEYRRFEEHDTFGFNWFIRENFLRCDYHLIRDVADRDPSGDLAEIEEFYEVLRSNPHYADTVFLVQAGIGAVAGNLGIGRGWLPEGAHIFRFRTLGGRREPSRSLRRGVARGYATLEDCVNLAFLLGWRRIVLVGVDLYDRRYFWLPPDEARLGDIRRGATAADPHMQASTGHVELLGEWGRWLRAEGVELEVYNPRSLLAAVLPVYAAPVRSME